MKQHKTVVGTPVTSHQATNSDGFSRQPPQAGGFYEHTKVRDDGNAVVHRVPTGRPTATAAPPPAESSKAREAAGAERRNANTPRGELAGRNGGR